MELRIWIIMVVGLVAFVLVLWAVERLIYLARSSASRGSAPNAQRRAVTGAAFALQQVFEPGIEHVVRAEQDEPGEDDTSGGEGDWDAWLDTHRQDLAESLGRTPVDPEEVKRVLASAQRLGLDWRALFEDAVALELTNRPFRAPFLPSASKVAPRIDAGMADESLS